MNPYDKPEITRTSRPVEALSSVNELPPAFAENRSRPDEPAGRSAELGQRVACTVRDEQVPTAEGEGVRIVESVRRAGDHPDEPAGRGVELGQRVAVLV